MLTMELQCLIPRINDDNIDNFHIELRPKQYADIEEDEPILHPLCNEYDRVLWWDKAV